MDLSFVTEYISPIILVFCIGLGYLIHSRKNEIYDSFIPIIVAVVGILAAIGSFGTFDLKTIVIGMISGLASTGLYEAFKNMLNLPEAYAAEAIDIPFGGKHAAEEE